jgi:hypothetical protein
MSKNNKNLLLLEINECNFAYFFKVANKFNNKNINNYFYNKKNLKTYTRDKQEGYNLDPWVQWVSVHTGLESSKHKVFRIGQKLDGKFYQIWDGLCAKGLSCSIWGAFNAILRKKNNIVNYMPDPWSFTQFAYPNNLNNLLKLSRYYAKTYPSSNNLKLILYFIFFLKEIIFSKTIIYILKNFSSFLLIFFKCRIKSFNLYFFLDLISLVHFINIGKKSNTNFNIIALNCFAHYQHNYWDEDRYEEIYYWYLKKFIEQFQILEEKYNSVIVFNGFDQKKIHNEFHLRPKNFNNFFKILEINFLNIEPDMTAGAFIFFKNFEDKINALNKIKLVSIFNYPLFEVVDFKNLKKIFVKIQLVFNTEIRNINQINAQNYKDLIQKIKKIVNRNYISPDSDTLQLLFNNIHFRKSTSRHTNIGNLYYKNFNFNKLNIKEGKLLNYKIYGDILAHFE